MARNSYGTTWWGRQWLNSLEGIDFQNRIPRGKTYANTGRVYNFSLDLAKGLIKARVSGNYDPFYSVKIKLHKINSKKADAFIDALLQSPIIISKLATRQLDPLVADIADKYNIRVFPKSWRDFDFECSCPDFAVPCKHIAALIYIISREIDANPFILFELQGIDILQKLSERGFNFEDTVSEEIPSWMSFITADTTNSPLMPDALKELSFCPIEKLDNGILNLLTDAPAGFTQGSLKDFCAKVLTKAVKLSENISSSKEDRDMVRLPKNMDTPFIKVNSFGQSSVLNLTLNIYPSKGNGQKQTYILTDTLNDSFETKPLYYIFSGMTNAKDLENESIELEALYYIWLIAQKLIQAKAVMPQMYECIEGIYRIRWIPAILNTDVRNLITEVGKALQSFDNSFIQIDRATDFKLDAYQLGLIVLSIFIESFIKESYRKVQGINDIFELRALFEGELIDVEETVGSKGIKLRMESWLQPLFIKDLEISPVIVLTDPFDIKSSLFHKDMIGNANVLDSLVDADKNTPLSQDTNNTSLLDSKTALYKHVDKQYEDDANSDGIKEIADIVIDIGFKTQREDGSFGFVLLRDIINNEFYSNIKLSCLKTISKLGSIVPNLIEVLKDDDYHSVVDISQLSDLILNAIPALKLLGIRLIVPKSLKSLLHPQSSLHLDVSKFDSDVSMLNLTDLLSFDWSMSVGSNKLNEKDFDKLLSSKFSIVRYKESFISIDPKELALLKKRLLDNTKKPKPIELIAAALSGEYEGSKVILSQKMQKAIDTIFKEKYTEVSDSLNAHLRDYQMRGFSWLYKNSQASIGSIIADDMGLGKTLQVIATLDKLRQSGFLDEKPALIVVPSSLLVNWQREMHKFAPKLTYSVFYGIKKNLNLKCHVVLTTYGVMIRTADKELSHINFRLCIIDEAQAIKNSKTANFKKLKKIKADSRIAMSGTPVENRLAEYWSIMDFVNPGLLGSEREFYANYAKPIEKQRDLQVVEKFKRVTAPFVMRRLKTDKSVINDLPEKISTNQYCTLSKDQLALYQSKVDSALGRLENKEVDRQALLLEMIIALKQICNCPQTYELDDKDFDPKAVAPEDSGKALSLFELLDELIDSGKKTIIFTQFTKMGNLLKQWCHDRYNMDVDFFYGGQSQREKTKIVDDFQNDRSKKILILSLRAAGTGLNLTAASAVVHYDLWWNPAVESQATDRAYRIGQKSNVNVYRLICANTFEEKIDEIIQSKKELADLTVNAGENWIGDLSNRQLKELFSLSNE